MIKTIPTNSPFRTTLQRELFQGTILKKIFVKHAYCLDVSTKFIADVLNLEPNSVEKSQTRDAYPISYFIRNLVLF